jgi:ubiquinone/menaquinone biosynthesis C-methylase UbiE
MTDKTNLAPPDLDTVRAHFDTYAGSWHDRLTEHPYAVRRKIVASLIQRCCRDRTADIGCGTGDYSPLFDLSQGDYVGFDLSPKMIDQCRALYPNYRFEVSQAEPIPLPDNSVTLALSVAVLEYYEDPTMQLAELSRILEADGDVIVCVPNGANVSKTAIAWLDRRIVSLGRLRKKQPAKDGDSANMVPKEFIHTRYLAAELRRLASLHRLEMIDTRYASLRFFPTTFGWLRSANVGISNLLSGVRAFNWFSAYFATILICRFRKMA